jgi:hypothetical protein
MSERTADELDVTDTPSLDPCERRVVSVEPITGDTGAIEVHALYRNPESDGIDHHIFSFMYNYLGDDRRCLLGLDEWDPPSDTVTGVDMSVLQYVKAYFNEYGLPVTASISVTDGQVSDFEADASLQVTPESEDTDDSTQWVEGP